jgi:peptidyl-prolyl cis-trans isomerase D
MLERIRESSQGLAAKIILGFIILTFAVAGIGSYTNSADTSVAEVNGEKISQADFEKAYQAQRNRMVQQFGDMFDTLSSNAEYMANFRNSIVDSLINERLVDQITNDMAIRVSDQRIKQTIREMPEFQVEGKFDNNRYLAIINQAGFYQSSNFRDYLRTEMVRRQLTQSLLASEFSLPYQEVQLTALQNQLRDFRFATLSSAQFEQDIEILDTEISEYYLANQNRFQNQEKIKVDYIALDVNDIALTVAVTDEDIDRYYQENIANYQQDEQRRVSHILIEFGDDEVAAKNQIDQLLKKVNEGEDFASIAKEFSADTFSGENGGDLEWLEVGVMDEAFEQAAFALTTVGTVSDVVKTDFGYHLIKLTELKPEQLTPLADVAEELKATVSKQKAEDKFFELQQEMARLSFEFPDSLDDAATAIDSEVQTSDWISRMGNSAPFNDPKIIDTVFSDLIVNEQVNSDIIEVSDSLAIVLRANQYQPANVKPLSEVSDLIKQTLVSQKASDKARILADELLVSFKAGNDILEQLTANGSAFVAKVDVMRQGSDVDSSIVNEAFRLPHPTEGQLSATTLVLNNGDLALIELQTVKSGDTKPNPSFAQQQTQQLAQMSYQSFVETLRAKAEISKRNIDTSTQ